MSDEATIYRDEPLQVYVDDAASGKPAPGGGSVSACAGALGAALVSMVCNLTIGKEKFAAVESRLGDVVARSEACRSELERLLQDDTTAYNGVIEGYRLPKDSPEQQAARAAHIQAALKVAANVPLEIARVALRVCRLAKTAAELEPPRSPTLRSARSWARGRRRAPPSTCSSTWARSRTSPTWPPAAPSFRASSTKP